MSINRLTPAAGGTVLLETAHGKVMLRVKDKHTAQWAEVTLTTGEWSRLIAFCDDLAIVA